MPLLHTSLSLMRKIKFILLFCLIASCGKSTLDRNPYLTEYSFTKTINLNLPTYNALTYPGNAVYIGDEGAGIKGVIVINQGNNTFRAWEATCPNHTPSSCSTMTITGGIYCECSCEGYTYNLYTGSITAASNDGQAGYNLLYYQSTLNGNILTISN